MDSIKSEQMNRIEKKLDKLIAYVIPVLTDVTKYLVDAKRLANKGKKPRRQPKKRFKW